jgi:hypothetical protein
MADLRNSPEQHKHTSATGAPHAAYTPDRTLSPAVYRRPPPEARDPAHRRQTNGLGPPT